MNTGDFNLNFGQLAISILFPMMLVFTADKGLKIYFNLISEDHESKIDWLLTLSGMHKVTLLCMDLIVFSIITLPLMLIIGLIADLIALPSLGVMACLFLVLIYTINMNMVFFISKYLLEKKSALLFRVFFTIGSFLISLITSI